MTPSESTKASTKRGRPAWWPWHQHLGVGFSAVIVIVVITGIGLNHTGSLQLDERRITAPWILNWYGMIPDGEPVGFEADGWAIQWDSGLYWNGAPVASSSDPLVGAVSVDSMRVLATRNALFLVSSTGALIERLDASSLPPGQIVEIGRLRNDVYLLTTESRFISDEAVTEWDRYQLAADIETSTETSIPEAEREAVLESYRGGGVTLYRVVLDLHSGRLFGSMGVWVVDAAAVVMLFLTLTGLWYALRVKRR